MIRVDSLSGLCAGRHIVDDAEIVVTEQECVAIDAQNSAGTSVHDRLAIPGGQKSGNKVAGLAISGRETDDLVTRTDVRVAGSVERDEKVS